MTSKTSPPWGMVAPAERRAPVGKSPARGARALSRKSWRRPPPRGPRPATRRPQPLATRGPSAPLPEKNPKARRLSGSSSGGSPLRAHKALTWGARAGPRRPLWPRQSPSRGRLWKRPLRGALRERRPPRPKPPPPHRQKMGPRRKSPRRESRRKSPRRERPRQGAHRPKSRRRRDPPTAETGPTSSPTSSPTLPRAAPGPDGGPASPGGHGRAPKGSSALATPRGRGVFSGR